LKDHASALSDFEESLRLNPNHAPAYNSLAWLLATTSDARFRDGKRALESAKKACELTSHQTPEYLSVLAAAYAETGQFDQAIFWQTRALENPRYVETSGAKARRWLQLYQEGKPLRDPDDDARPATTATQDLDRAAPPVVVVSRLPADPSPTQPTPRIDHLILVDKGIYTFDIVGKVETPKTPSGFRNKVTNITLLKDTTTIPLVKGTHFGLRFTVAGEPKGSQVTFKIFRIYPEGGRRSVRTGEKLYQDDYFQKVTIGGNPCYFGTDLGTNEPLGIWTYQVWLGNRLLLEQKFETVRP